SRRLLSTVRNGFWHLFFHFSAFWKAPDVDFRNRGKVTGVGSDHLKVLFPRSCSNESISQMVMQIGIFLQQCSEPIGNLWVRVHDAIPLQDSQRFCTLTSTDGRAQHLFTCNSGVVNDRLGTT